MSMSYIGGADGPTSIFLAGKVGVSWINLFGLIIFLLIMIPNIIYFIKFKRKFGCSALKLFII